MHLLSPRSVKNPGTTTSKRYSRFEKHLGVYPRMASGESGIKTERDSGTKYLFLYLLAIINGQLYHLRWNILFFLI